MIEAKLIVVGGSEQEEFVLDLPATIGRGSDNSITLRDALISRQHCRIGVRDGSLVITDLDSLNGTYIGREKVGGQSELPPNALLTVGTVTFRAVYGDASSNELESAGNDNDAAGHILDGDTVDLAEGATVIDPGEKTQPAGEPASPVESPL